MLDIQSSTVTIMVSDMDRAVQFYTATLGFKLKQRYQDHYAEIQAPGLLIGLHPSRPDLQKGYNMSMGFSVKKLDDEVAKLEAQGLQAKVVNDGPVRIANFHDPDENALYLIELKEW